MFNFDDPHGLRAFFEPNSIAVIGADAGNDRAGARTLNNLVQFGYSGSVYPVTRRHDELHGFPCYRDIASLPAGVDLAVICVAASRAPQVLAECGEKGFAAAVVYATGFGGETAEGARLEAELRDAQQQSGIRLLGPNTIGTRGVVQSGVFATFSHDIEGGITPGPVAMIAQSGGLGVYFGSAYLRRRGVGTRYLVDTGNEFDVDAAEVLEYVAKDPDVSCVALILEGTRNGRRLLAAVRSATGSGIPVVFLKAGRSTSASAQVASHTGAIAGDGALFEAALAQAGAKVVDDEMDLVDAVTVLASGHAPKGRRLGVVTPSGGYAILTMDAAERYGMSLPAPAAPPSPEEAIHLASGDLRNPFDYTSLNAAGSETLKTALAWMLRQDNFDAVLLWQAYSLEIPHRREQLRDALRAVLPGTTTPLFGCGLAPPTLVDELRDLGVMWFEEPTRLVRTLSVVAPDADRSPPAPEQATEKSPISVVVGPGARRLISELEHVETVEVASGDAAEKMAWNWGGAILKVESTRYPHKTEFGLVTGRLRPEEVQDAFSEVHAARTACGEDHVPIVAQPCEVGIELALGGYHDPVFGPAVLIGMGGVHIELLRDVALNVAPVDVDTAKSMILSLRGAPLLLGARGRPRADIEAAAQALVSLSQFMAKESGQWTAVDVNPLIVRPEGMGAVAVDIVLVPSEERNGDE